MKITRMRNWNSGKVESDQPGHYGWGEATLEWKKGIEPLYSVAVIETEEVQADPVSPR